MNKETWKILIDLYDSSSHYALDWRIKEKITKHQTIILKWVDGEDIVNNNNPDNILSKPLFNPHYNYSVKTKTQMINGVECPYPITELCGQKAYYSPSMSLMTNYKAYMETEVHSRSGFNTPFAYLLDRGVLYRTSEDAIKITKAMLGVL